MPKANDSLWALDTQARSLSIQEALLTKGVEESFRHCLVVLLGVAYVSEDLSEGFLVVYLDEMLVLWELLLRAVILVDVGWSVVLIGLVVDDAFERKAVALWRILVRPAM